MVKDKNRLWHRSTGSTYQTCGIWSWCTDVSRTPNTHRWTALGSCNQAPAWSGIGHRIVSWQSFRPPPPLPWHPLAAPADRPGVRNSCGTKAGTGGDCCSGAECDPCSWAATASETRRTRPCCWGLPAARCRTRHADSAPFGLPFRRQSWSTWTSAWTRCPASRPTGYRIW